MIKKKKSKHSERIKKVKQPSAKQYKTRLWNLIKEWIRKKDPHECDTCGAKNLTGSNLQTGHFIPSCICGPELRYDPRNLRLQCMSCNCHRGGWGERFAEMLEMREGKEYVEELRRIQRQSKTTKVDWEYWINFYTQQLNELHGQTLPSSTR